VYVGEGLYIAADDAAADNDQNNASYRLMTYSTSLNRLQFTGGTELGKPGIMAWQEHGNGFNNPDNSVSIDSIEVPGGDGWFFYGSKASDLGGGETRFEYAVQNISSDRSGGSFTIPLPGGSVVTDASFAAPAYHSGEPYSNTAWTIDIASDSITFSSPETFAQNQNTNALRWGSLYNFGFTVNKEAGEGQAELGLFKPGAIGSVMLDVAVPAGESGCNAADISAEFGVLNANDIIDFVNGFNASAAIADVSPVGGDGLFNANDIIDFVNAFNAGCP
jgi:hypothetical protein